MIFLEGSSVHIVYAAVLHLRWVLGGFIGLKCVAVMATVQKRLKTTGLVWQVTQAMHKDKNSHSGPYTGQPLREKVHIWLGSLHAANFIYCLCDDCLFIYQKILCVYVLEKVKTVLHFFSHSPTIIDKYFCWKWMNFRKIYQGCLSFF